MSRDGGKTWVNLGGKFPGLPPRASAGRLIASSHDEARAFATFNNHRQDDYTPYVYVTADYGQTWASLAATLPKDETINCITEDPKNPNVLYLGSESGLFVTIDRGQRWVRVKNNLPTVPVDEITIHPRENDLLLATHGRSLWVLDDITPIQQWAEALKSPGHLFDIRPATEFNRSDEFAGYPGDRRFWGQNPEFGAAVTYYVDKSPEKLAVTVRDQGGKLIREFSQGELKGTAGLNRVYWDLRYQPVAPPRPRAQQPAPAGPSAPGRGSPGPFVLPGEYRVSLIVDGAERGVRTVRVLGDPMINISEADRRAHHDMALELHRIQFALNEASDALNAAGDQVASAQNLLKLVSSPPEPLVKSVEALAKRAAALTRRIGSGGRPGGGEGGGEEPPLRNLVSGLKNQILFSTSAPTAQQAQSARDAREQTMKLITDVNELLASALPSLGRSLRENRLQAAPMAPIEPVKLTSSP
jgi:hypothetical protein